MDFKSTSNVSHRNSDKDELSSFSQPARSAHPNIKFNCTNQEPLVIENLPFDKYELEPSPLTQYILARKQPTGFWQVSDGESCS